MTVKKHFLTPFFLLLFALSVQAQKEVLPIIENKGQWPENIIASTEINGGKVFFEHDRITFNLLDLSKYPHADQNPIKAEELDKLTFPGHVFQTQFIGANLTAKIKKQDTLETYYNYFLGSDSSKWAGGCKSFVTLAYENIYPGIDLHYYSSKNSLKYDFVVLPKANPNAIDIAYQGVDSLWLDAKGNLHFATHTGEHQELKPVAYQKNKGKNQEVACRFELKANRLRFVFPDSYKRSDTLIIDPELVFSTYSGSVANNFGYTATYDDKGFLYGAGSVFDQGYPTTTGAYDVSYNSPGVRFNTDVGITKISPDGKTRIYSTYLGGNNPELPHSLIVDANEQLIVFGTTGSSNFPTTTDAFNRSFLGGPPINYAPPGVIDIGVRYPNGSDIFVSKFNQTGVQLNASTLIGGDKNDGLNDALRYNYADQVRGEVEIDPISQDIYIATCTNSANFPIVNGMQRPKQTGQDGVIVKLSADLTKIIWSNILGGNQSDAAFSISFSKQNLVVCGGTRSDSLTNSIIPDSLKIQGKNKGLRDGFIVLMPTSGDTILQETFWGSNRYDQIYLSETDLEGNIFVLGQTEDTTNRFYDTTRFGQEKSGQFLSKFTPELDSLLWTTTIGQGGGRPNISPTAMLVDFCDRIIFVGWGGGFNRGRNNNMANNIDSLPIKVEGIHNSNPNYRKQTTLNGADFYIAMLEPDAEDLIFASYYGNPGVDDHVDGGTCRFDKNGILYMAVCACENSNFPTFPSSVISTTNNSPLALNPNNPTEIQCNMANFKIDFDPNLIDVDFDIPPLICSTTPTYDISFINKSEGGKLYEWDFGNGIKSFAKDTTITFDVNKTYDIKLRAFNAGSCNVSKEITKTVTIIKSGELTLDTLFKCFGKTVSIGTSELSVSGATYTWFPTTGLSSPNSPVTDAFLTQDIDYTLTLTYQTCVTEFKQNIKVERLDLIANKDTLKCLDGTPLKLIANSGGTSTNFSWSLNGNTFLPRENALVTDSVIFVNPTVPTTYYIRAVTALCNQIDTIKVSPINLPDQLNPEQLFCQGDSLTLSIANFNSSHTYKWTPNQNFLGPDNGKQIRVKGIDGFMYYLSTKSPEGCTTKDSIVTRKSPLSDVLNSSITLPPGDVLVGVGNTVKANPQGPYIYRWRPNDLFSDSTAATTTLTPKTNPTSIELIVSDGFCSLPSAVSIKTEFIVCGKPNFFVPNAFTPNGDGENDKVFLRGLYVKSMLFTIFDRWGKKVFETSDQNIGWDGTLDGKLLDPQVFVYQLDVLCLDDEKYTEKGNITLIR